MGTLVCRVELNKTTGVTVTVENADGKITQTYHLDGTAITTTCKGDQDTSTITQKCDSIAIQCKTFTLDAETITCKSTKDTLHESQSKLTAKSTQDMELNSSAKLIEKATQDATLDGMNVTITATADAKVKGVNVTGEATAQAKLTGSAGMEVSTTGNGKVSASMMKVEGTAMANFESGGVTTLKGSMLNISGPLVKVG
jgi:hypothetical protein